MLFSGKSWADINEEEEIRLSSGSESDSFESDSDCVCEHDENCEHDKNYEHDEVKIVCEQKKNVDNAESAYQIERCCVQGFKTMLESAKDEAVFNGLERLFGNNVQFREAHFEMLTSKTFDDLVKFEKDTFSGIEFCEPLIPREPLKPSFGISYLKVVAPTSEVKKKPEVKKEPISESNWTGPKLKKSVEKRLSKLEEKTKTDEGKTRECSKGTRCVFAYYQFGLSDLFSGKGTQITCKFYHSKEDVHHFEQLAKKWNFLKPCIHGKKCHSGGECRFSHSKVNEFDA